MGGQNIRPNAADATHRIKKLVVGKRFNQSLHVNSASLEQGSFTSAKSFTALVSSEPDTYSKQVPIPEAFDEITEMELVDSDIELHSTCR
jgi:hypothetical protein